MKVDDMPNNNINKVLVAVLTASIVAMAAWTVKQTHQNTVDTSKVYTMLAQISQKVDDGKESRLAYQVTNDNAHKTILESLSTLVPRNEFELRIRILDDRIKVLDDRIKTIEERSKTIDERTRLIEERARLIEEKVKIIETRFTKGNL